MSSRILEALMLDCLRFQSWLKSRTGVSLKECWRSAKKVHQRELYLFPERAHFDIMLWLNTSRKVKHRFSALEHRLAQSKATLKE